MEKDFLSNMAISELREKTFKNWPFKKGPCTASEMAKAGFYMPPQKPTNIFAVVCYYCFKELEGWEDSDVPFEEHRKHAPFCCFIKGFKKPPRAPLTLEEVLELELGRNARIIELERDKLMQTTLKKSETTLKSLKKKAKGRPRK